MKITIRLLYVKRPDLQRLRGTWYIFRFIFRLLCVVAGSCYWIATGVAWCVLFLPNLMSYLVRRRLNLSTIEQTTDNERSTNNLSLSSCLLPARWFLSFSSFEPSCSCCWYSCCCICFSYAAVALLPVTALPGSQ